MIQWRYAARAYNGTLMKQNFASNQPQNYAKMAIGEAHYESYLRVSENPFVVTSFGRGIPKKLSRAEGAFYL